MTAAVTGRKRRLSVASLSFSLILGRQGASGHRAIVPAFIGVPERNVRFIQGGFSVPTTSRRYHTRDGARTVRRQSILLMDDLNNGGKESHHQEDFDATDVDGKSEQHSTTSEDDNSLDVADDGGSSVSSQQSVSISLENLDALLTESSNLSYFYLQNEVGLSPDVMWKITLEAGSVLGMTATTVRHKIDLLRRTMDLSDDDIRIMLERHPAILHLSADKNLAPTILFFVRALDLSRDELRAIVVQFPSVLCYSKRNLRSKFNFFMRLMGYSVEECRSLFLSEPKLLIAGVRTGLIPHMRFYLREMEIPVDKLRTIVRKNPKVMLYSVEDNIIPKLIFFFVMMLQCTTSHIQRLLLSYPQILDYNLENHMRPITNYLMEELGFGPTEVRQILLKFPRLMTHSLARVKHVVGLLRFELELDPTNVKRILYQAPQAVGLADETLKSKMTFLRDSFELSDDELRRVLAGMPTLILCSVERNLEPKAAFLREAFGNDAKELRETIVTQPALLGYSLEKRIRPRMEQLLQAGGHPRGISIGIPMKNQAFDDWLQGRKRRLAKNPNLEAMSRAAKKRKKEKAKTESGPLAPVASPKRKSSADGRIVHWTRERDPRPRP